MGTETARRRLCVAIPTFRRPDLLERLLTALAAQTLPNLRTEAVIVVLDNDPDVSARPVVARAGPRSALDVRYEHVAAPGLCVVRNRALAAATALASFMVMIDDDVEPERQWLEALVDVQERTDADAVVGSIAPRLPENAPSWLGPLRARETPTFADGAVLADGWSCNALVRLETVRRMGLTFDPELNFRGGEDLLFFRRLRALGGTIVFASRARASEAIPAARTTLAFNLLRSFRRGNSLAYSDMKLRRSLRTFAVRAVKGLGYIGIGALRYRPVPGIFDAASGLGMLSGLCGFMYRAYAREKAG